MPNPGRRMDHNLVTVSDADRLSLTSNDWNELEAALGAAIPTTARKALLELCREHLAQRKLEQEAVSLGRVRHELSKLAQLAGGSDLAHEEAYRRIFSHLAGFRIEVDLADPVSGTEGDWNEPEQPVTVALQRATVEPIVYHLRVAANKALQEIDQELAPTGSKRGGPFAPGTSFRTFLTGAVAWAESCGLPSSVNNRDGTAKPFSEFAFALHGKFPTHLREAQMASPLSLQKRVNDAIRASKRRT